MTAFLWNLLLALAWMALTGQFTPTNLLIGFGIGYLVMALVSSAFASPGYFLKVRQAISFFLFYLWQLFLANLRVAYHVVTPAHSMRAGVIAIPLDAETDIEITMLANVLTMVPGSLSLDVSADRKTLYVHMMDIERDPEHVRRQIKEGFERRVLALLR